MDVMIFMEVPRVVSHNLISVSLKIGVQAGLRNIAGMDGKATGTTRRRRAAPVNGGQCGNSYQ